MTLPFLSKFKKEVGKYESVGVGIKTVEDWLTTGNYALNRALSGDYMKGVPLSRITLFAGPSGSGKSFITMNIAYQAQKEGYHVLIIDTENAIDVTYLQKIGVKIDEDHLTYLQVATIEDVNGVLSEFFVNYQKTYGKDNPEAPKTLVIIDSLAMLSSSTEMENYDKGVIKGDQGQLAKRRKAMLRLAVGKIARLPIKLLITDHVYPQDIMMGDGAWAITNSTKFSSSIIGIITKLKLKEDGDVVGVRMRFETYKSRFAKLGTKVELEIPYNKGMSSTSGLLELLEADGVIKKGTQPGEKLLWVAEVNGERITFKEKEFDDKIARKLLKHPACAPLLARDEAEIDIEALDATDDTDYTDLPSVASGTAEGRFERKSKSKKTPVTEE